MTTSVTRILLATDGSEEAALAGRAAADLSNNTAAELHLVHVWTDVLPPAYPSVSLDNYSRLAKEEAKSSCAGRRGTRESQEVGLRDNTSGKVSQQRR